VGDITEPWFFLRTLEPVVGIRDRGQPLGRNCIAQNLVVMARSRRTPRRDCPPPHVA